VFSNTLNLYSSLNVRGNLQTHRQKKDVLRSTICDDLPGIL
jgi:hypothetical protein